MKKIVMAIVFMMVMCFTSFGSEKEYEYVKYYEDTVDSINYEHEPVVEGKTYVSRFDDVDLEVHWRLDGNTIACEEYKQVNGVTHKLKYNITGITNGVDKIYFYDFGEGNEWGWKRVF